MHNGKLNTKKEHKSKDKKIIITRPINSVVNLLYYEGETLKKSKSFVYPHSNSGKRQIDLLVNREYRLWLNCLWYYGYLEEDDVQLLEFKKLKENT